MSNEAPLVISSHRGPYSVNFGHEPEAGALQQLMEGSSSARRFVLADRRVLSLYPAITDLCGDQSTAIGIDATETAKSLDNLSPVINQLLAKGVRRGDRLVAVGGGVIQDITCFLANILLRGLDWYFVPTTLLAQADSCIGSKSSINVAEAKNVLGTFYPPRAVFVFSDFLNTLGNEEICSGLGEILKVHAISGPSAFDALALDYGRLSSDRELMLRYIRRSLEIKKQLIELDEFDTGPRNVMNYGHTFGHAIEKATDFSIPHGIAVTIGMDMANFVAMKIGHTRPHHFSRMHPILRLNYQGFETHEIPLAALIASILRDKKNSRDKLGLILPDADGIPKKVMYPPDIDFERICSEYLGTARKA